MKTLVAALIAMAIATPAPASAEELTGHQAVVEIHEKKAAEIAAKRKEIRALPFVRTVAYAMAINEFCFPETPIPATKISELVADAVSQSAFGHGDDSKDDGYDDALRRAAEHLMNSYDACEPAIAYVEKTLESYSERKAELDALIAQIFEIKAGQAK